MKAKPKSFSKILAFCLVIAIFSSACDVPDISKFTEQSAEMTRGIRKGVKDTESVFRALSVREDLYSSAQLQTVKGKLTEYQTAVKPTIRALEALDAYLEALNALAQANNKSVDNSSAVVNSVTGLVDAVAGIKLAGAAVNIATGLLTLAEQFRTAKAFKERVNIASKIVEGKYQEKKDSNGQIVKDSNGKPVLVKACTDKTKGEIDAILRGAGGTKEADVADKGCGVVDFIKFNIVELKVINNTLSNLLFTGFRSKHSAVISLYKQLNSNNANLDSEMVGVLNFQNLSSVVKEDYDNNSTGSDAIQKRFRLLNTEMRTIFALDPGLAAQIDTDLTTCGAACSRSKTVIDKNIMSFPELVALDECGKAENVNKQYCQFMENVVKQIDSPEFTTVVGIIALRMEPKRKALTQRIDLNYADLQRINPTYQRVMAEIKVIHDRQEQLDQLLDTSTNALDAWTDSHANLRVAVNTKKPLTVSRLVSKVREIWEIIEKGPAKEN